MSLARSKRMRCPSIVVLFLSLSQVLVSGCTSGEQKKIGFLELRAVTKEVHVPYVKDSKQKPCVRSCQEIVYKLVNHTDKRYMLYNFKRNFQFGLDQQSLLCDSAWTSIGKTLYMFAKDSSFVPAAFVIHDSSTVSSEAMHRQMQFGQTWQRNSRVILSPGEYIEFSQMVDFRDYYLDPGSYFIKLGYAQLYLLPSIGKEEFESDLDGADLFVGCLFSEPVKFVVDLN